MPRNNNERISQSLNTSKSPKRLERSIVNHVNYYITFK